MTPEKQAKVDAYNKCLVDDVKAMPAIWLSEFDLSELGEYSCSRPTGTTIGKRWKKDMRAYIRELEHLPPLWVVCEYAKHADPKKVKIIYYQPRFLGKRIKALS